MTRKIIVSEYPKSGGNWLVSMIGDALNIPKRDIYMQGKWHVFDASNHPWYLGKQCFDFPELCVIKSHEIPESELLKKFDATYIHLVRDGRDVVVSKYFYEKDFCVQNGILKDFNFTFEEYVPMIACEWAFFVEAWRAKQVITVHYERLLTESIKELNRVLLEITGQVINQGCVESAVSKNTKENFSKSLEKTFKYNSFVRKGISGDWKNYFSADDLTHFNKVASGAMLDFGY
jgi:hypothetical protein